MANELQIGAMDPSERDPDFINEFTKEGVNPSANALKIIQGVAKLYPPEFVAAASRPIDQERTDTLDYGELRRLYRGDHEVLDDAAAVRGKGDNAVVFFIVQTENGRSHREVLPYSKFSNSQSRHEEERKRRLSVASAARRAGAKDDELGGLAEDDPRVQALEEEVARLREELELAQDPPPFEGYDDETADDLKAHVRESESAAELERIAQYEPRHKNRATVAEAAKKRLQELTAPAGDEE